MNLFVRRIEFTQTSTLGELYIDGEFFCHTLEDKDRYLEDAPTPLDMMARKIPGETAIPRGKYRVEITFSNRFQNYLPEVKDVPVFTGIRIHAGNNHHDTHGCILVGDKYDIGEISSSRVTLRRLMDRLEGQNIELEIA